MSKENELNVEKFEQDIVAALTEAAELRPDRQLSNDSDKLPVVQVKRGDKILFTFKVHPLSEGEWAKCRRQNLKNRGKRTEELDDARFASQVVYEATIDEDKEKFWKNKELWKRFNVVTGVDLVSEVLTYAERSKIAETVMNLAGFDDDLEDLIKN